MSGVGTRASKLEALRLLSAASSLLRALKKEVEKADRNAQVSSIILDDLEELRSFRARLLSLSDSAPSIRGEIFAFSTRLSDLEEEIEANSRKTIFDQKRNDLTEAVSLPSVVRGREPVTLKISRYEVDEASILFPAKRSPLGWDGNLNSIQRKINQLTNDIDRLEQLINQYGDRGMRFTALINNSIASNENEINATISADYLLDAFRELSQLLFRNSGGLTNVFENISSMPSSSNIQRVRKGIAVIKRLLVAHFGLYKTDFVYDFRQFPHNDGRRGIYHREFLLRLFIILSALPINVARQGFFVIQANFIIDRGEGGEFVTKFWYVHPQSSAHLLSGLFNALRTIELAQTENEQTNSDPVSILKSGSKLRYVRFMPISTFLSGEDRNTEMKLLRGELIPEPLIRDWVFELNGSRFSFEAFNQQTFLPLFLERALIPEVRMKIREDQRRLLEAAGEENFSEDEKKKYWSYHLGGFFPFFHQTDLDLTRYQIPRARDDFINHKTIYDKSCLIYALEMSGQFREEEIEQMSSICYGRVIPIRKLVEVCSSLGFAINLKRIYSSEKHPSRSYFIGQKTAEKIINLGLIENHFFIIDKAVKVTSFYIKNFERIQEFLRANRPGLIGQEESRRINGIREARNNEISFARSDDRLIDSFNLIKLLVENKLISPVTMGDVISLDMILYKDIKIGAQKEYLGDLNFEPKLCLQSFKEFNDKVKPKPVSKNATKINTLSQDENKEMIGKALVFFADFEAFTVDNQNRPLEKHLPFLCCASHNETDEIESFEGLDCGRQLLDYIVRVIKTEPRFKNWCPLVYFHNLGYDINFLAKYGIINSLPRGRKMLCCEIIYQNVIITFKDSASLLPMKLENFGSTFGLKVHKEIFPYNFYTAERYFDSETEGVVPFQEVLDFTGWHLGDKYYSFADNIREVEGLKEDEDIELFNMRNYAKFYCGKDVEVLKAGVNMFIESIRQDFGIEATNYLSISSIADAIFNKEVYSKIPKLFKVGGIVREFMSYAVHGGRVMPAENKKWAYRLTAPEIRMGYGLCDFDAVSLYPSAMARLWLVDGTPKVMSTEDLMFNSYFENPKYSAYIVEILITKIYKKRQFPLVIGRNPETGSVLNTNDAPVRMVVCDIELEDLKRFQQIEFKTIRGIYWDGQKHFEIQDCIKKIFKKRAEYKEQKNPIQNVYKLIMNSIYGKTILKPNISKFTYIRRGDPDLARLFKHHSAEIQYINQIDESDILAIKRTKSIGLHFNFSLFGIHILAMSKRIMNEVMCLAEDLGMRIFYQDTDSMHIEKKNLEHLAGEFHFLYKRELIGSDLGQFHSDFELKPNSTNVRSIEAYFIGKKCYIDKLIDDQGNEGIHMRLKGVPQASIIDLANREFNGDVLEVYRQLALGNTLRFNLLAGSGVKFDYTRSMTIRNKEHFERNVGFTKTLPPENYENGAFIYVSMADGEVFEDRVSKKLI